MKFTATIFITAAASAAAFAPVSVRLTPSTKASARSASALDASIVDTLAGMEGPGQVWGAEGIAVGKEESDLRGYDGFGKFVQALQSTGVAQTLSGPGPYTVFAPTDTAVDAYVSRNGPIDANAINYCIVPGNVPSSALAGANLQNLAGTTLTYGRRFRKDFVNDSIIGEKTFGPYSDFPVDVACDNGVIHSVGLMLDANA